MPLLIAESITFGIVASYFMAVEFFGVPHAYYVNHLTTQTSIPDIGIGMAKGAVFGILIVIIACQKGLSAKNGAVGVGRGTTDAVVNASLAILIVNLFLTLILNHFFPLAETGS
jgi:phospholipid/cholesterol/gamma-HCH transport system permease protein